MHSSSSSSCATPSWSDILRGARGRFLLLNNEIAIGIWSSPRTLPPDLALSGIDYMGDLDLANHTISLLVVISSSGKFVKVVEGASTHSHILEYVPLRYFYFVEQTLAFKNNFSDKVFPSRRFSLQKNVVPLKDPHRFQISSTLWKINSADKENSAPSIDNKDGKVWLTLASDNYGHSLSICPLRRILRLIWSYRVRSDIIESSEYLPSFSSSGGFFTIRVTCHCSIVNPSSPFHFIFSHLKELSNLEIVDVPLPFVDGLQETTPSIDEISSLDSVILWCSTLQSGDEFSYPIFSALQQPFYVKVEKQSSVVFFVNKRDLHIKRDASCDVLSMILSRHNCEQTEVSVLPVDTEIEACTTQLCLDSSIDRNIPGESQSSEEKICNITFCNEHFVFYTFDCERRAAMSQAIHCSLLPTMLLQQLNEAPPQSMFSSTAYSGRFSSYQLLVTYLNEVKKLVILGKYIRDIVTTPADPISQNVNPAMESVVYEGKGAKYTVLQSIQSESVNIQVFKIRGLFQDRTILELDCFSKVRLLSAKLSIKPLFVITIFVLGVQRSSS